MKKVEKIVEIGITEPKEPGVIRVPWENWREGSSSLIVVFEHPECPIVLNLPVHQCKDLNCTGPTLDLMGEAWRVIEETDEKIVGGLLEGAKIQSLVARFALAEKEERIIPNEEINETHA